MSRPAQDQSEPATHVRGSLRVWIESGPSELRGARVIEIAEPEPDVRHLRLDEPSAGRLVVTLPSGATLPIAIGQQLDLRVRFEIRGIHPIAHASVVDHASGAVLLACSGTGDPTWAPGWSIAVGPERGRSGGRIDHWVELHVADHHACVAGNEWRRLATPSGSWLICGHAVAWDPSQPLVPDASTYHCYELIRLE